MVTLQAAIMAAALSGLGQTVMLDFYADWCGPCRAMNPTVDALAAAGYPVQRINKDQHPELAAKFGVTAIPCFVMVVDGREVDRVVGGTSYSRLERMCKMSAAAAPPGATGPMLAMNGPPAANAFPVSQARTPQALNSGSRWSNSPAPMVQPLAPNASQPNNVQPVAAEQTRGASGVSDTALLAASVRLRIEDPDGRSCGSGTIIDSRDGEALIVTCGHVFRDSKGKGRITVDLFGPNGSQSVDGQLISYDLTRDVGLVAIRPTSPVVAARLAPLDYRITRGLPVASVGCNNGDNPTVRRSYLKALDKYVGPPTFTVDGQPVEGRSGGGLFTAEGYVIGVCNAADPSDKEGLFAALASIYAEIDKSRLDFVYKQPTGGLDRFTESNTATAIAAIAPPPMPNQMPNSMLGQMPTTGTVTPAAAMLTADTKSAAIPAHEQAALEEIQRRVQEGAEVVCIVRPRGTPDAKSEVIMLDHASPGFLQQLASQGRRQRELQELSYTPARNNCETRPTAKSIPESQPQRRVLLEWKAPEQR